MSHSINETIAQIQPLDDDAMHAARARQDQLTKPQGALGRLEALSIQIAGITRNTRPRFKQPTIITMAGDHGVARQGVSAYPSEVTPQMVLNFLSGGAAINVLARHVRRARRRRGYGCCIRSAHASRISGSQRSRKARAIFRSVPR